MSVGWNLDEINISEFPIIQIQFASITEITEDDFSISQLQKSIPIRLFILAHRIADFGIPSIFAESTPCYLIFGQDLSSSELDRIPSVIVFDLENKFDDFNQNNNLPEWAEFNRKIWSLQNPNNEDGKFFDLCEEFFDDLQQSITLKLNYQYHLFNPLFFTTYILIPPQTGIIDVHSKNQASNPFEFDSIIEPIIIKPVPVFVVNCIKIRWIVQSNLSCIVNPRCSPKIGSFILLPPFRHPLCINSISKEKTENKVFTFPTAAILPKINSKAIPIPITKGTVSRPISPALPTVNSFTTATLITITATTIDKEQTVTFKIEVNNESNTNTEYVLLSKPSIALYHFFYVKNFQYEYKKMHNRFPYQKKPQQQRMMQQQQQSQPQQQYPQYCHFEDLEIFDFDEKDIDNFFTRHFSEEAAGQVSSVTDQQEIASSYIEDALPSPYQLITEQVFDKRVKKRISRTINSVLLRYNPNISISEFFINPENDNKSVTLFTKRIDLELPKVSPSSSRCISFFTFLNFSQFFSFSNSVSPPIGQMFNTKEVTTFHHLGIPNILLNQDGTAKEVQADNFLPFWERDKCMPVSGPKSCNYVVFYETFDSISNSSNEDSLSAFISLFCHCYSHLGFGEMTPYSKSSVFIPVKLQQLVKTSTFSAPSRSQTPSLFSPTSSSTTETITSKVEMDIDSGTYVCDSMKKAVVTFMNSRPLLQYQDYPVVAFIVGGPSCHFFTLESDRKMKGNIIFKDLDSCPHLHTVWVSPEMILNAKADQIRALSFDVYGMIRSNQQGPIGNIEFMSKITKTKALQNQLAQKIQGQIQQLQSQPNLVPNQSQQEMQIKQMKKQLKHINFSNFFFKLFFGYRYQPPFILKQETDPLYMLAPESNCVNLNIAWDRAIGISVWTTDLGDLLHTAEANDFSDIMLMINYVCSYSQQQQQSGQNPLVKKITITLIEEYLGQSDYEKFNQLLPPNVDLFAFYHCPAVKAQFDGEFDDDIAVFDQLEIFNGIKMIQVNQQMPDGSNKVGLMIDFPANPESTCYVLSRHHQAYKMSIYKGGGQERLLQFVKSMSHLSWLSVKPGHEKRTSSYPPHINALIQQNNSSCSVISQFEFLPPD